MSMSKWNENEFPINNLEQKTQTKHVLTNWHKNKIQYENDHFGIAFIKMIEIVFIYAQSRGCLAVCEMHTKSFLPELEHVILKEYYEIVDEARPLSGFFPTHADFFTEIHF